MSAPVVAIDPVGPNPTRLASAKPQTPTRLPSTFKEYALSGRGCSSNARPRI